MSSARTYGDRASILRFEALAEFRNEHFFFPGSTAADSKNYGNWLCEVLKDQADRGAFVQWLSRKRMAERKARRAAEAKAAPGPNEIKTALLLAQFNSDEDIAGLVGILGGVYFQHIPVGFLNKVAFRLMPDLTRLGPTKDAPGQRVAGHIFQTCILGLNKDPLEESYPYYPPGGFNKNVVYSSILTDNMYLSRNDATGFAFLQLGALQYTRDLPTDTASQNAAYNPVAQWSDTGFVLVVEITHAGRAGDIYILSNIQPEDRYGERHPRPDGAWGFLPGDVSNIQRAGARIAGDFEELGASFEIILPDPKNDEQGHHIEFEFELVPCIRHLEKNRISRLWEPPQFAEFPEPEDRDTFTIRAADKPGYESQ